MLQLELSQVIAGKEKQVIVSVFIGGNSTVRIETEPTNPLQKLLPLLGLKEERVYPPLTAWELD